MNENQSSASAGIQHVHAAVFSLNAAFVTIALLLLYAPYPIISSLNRLEFSVNRLLHVRQTDLILGYWEFFLPGIALAICIWVFLRLSLHTQFTKEILRSVAGILALGAPAAYWLCATYAANRRYGWNPFHAIQLYELILILTLAVLYMRGKWPAPSWVSAVILLTHYSFWSWQFGPQLLMAFEGNGDSPGLTQLVSLFAGLTWVFYIRRAWRGHGGAGASRAGHPHEAP
jgi:hypothetical protein